MMLLLDDQIGIIPNLASQPLISKIYISIYLIFLDLVFNLEAIEAEVMGWL